MRPSNVVSYAVCRYSTSVSQPKLIDEIKHLMRDSAQPVAIITSFLRPGNGHLPQNTAARLVHGATLSSFTTVSMEPTPLVAFSFKLPSRMAQSLIEHHRDKAAGEPSKAHFIINLLSSSQSHLAGAFAKPGLKPYEWQGSGTPQPASDDVLNEDDDVHPLAREDEAALQESSSARWTDEHGSHGVPYLSDSLGSLACSLEGWVDLSGLQQSGGGGGGDALADANMFQRGSGEDAQSGSRLFIARVHAVEAHNSIDESRRPLIYWKQRFTTVQ